MKSPETEQDVPPSPSDDNEPATLREALRDLSESLATTLDSIGDGVIAMDSSGAVTRMNPVAEQLTGWTLAEARGRSLREVLPLLNGDTRDTVESPVDQTLREGIVVKLRSHTLLTRRDGTEIPIGDTCAPILALNGTVSGAVLVFRDLTAQRNAEATQAKLQSQLVFADRMAAVGTLAAGVAHEINNPLSVVVANVNLAIERLSMTNGDVPSSRIKELEETLLAARQGAARVATIVRGLNTFSRIEEERPAVIDLVPLIDLSIELTLNEIRHRALLVTDYGKVPLVEADSARLGQVFINLLVNAAQAFPEGTTENNEIRVATSTDAVGRAVVEVGDTGAGIPPELLSRVFDPFFTTKAVGRGTGLGLAISHSIVTGMGGQISVQSQVGRGTTFRVVLPPSALRQLPASAMNGHSNISSILPAQVLVVDDEPAIGLAIRRVLARHDVTTVTTAQDALDLFTAGKDFDVVLSDLMMPGMSGMELYRQLLKTHPKIARRVVFLTGGAFTPEAKEFLDRVDNDRMDKPFDVFKLREMVQKFARVRDCPERELQGAAALPL
jgi:PAS domain S-box-containing protein